MKMQLIRYKVFQFKSVMDSGWINCDDVTTLVGVNEAGKSNLLLALWKLNPAQDGEINFTDDMPVTLLTELRKKEKKPQFITAEFRIVDEELKQKIKKMAGCNEEDIEIVCVSRDYDGTRFISFPNYHPFEGYLPGKIVDYLNEKLEQINNSTEGRTEAGIKEEAIAKIQSALAEINDCELISDEELAGIETAFSQIDAQEMKTSTIRPLMLQVVERVKELRKAFEKQSPSYIADVQKLVIAGMPKFVYYSNYGNLDSEIYLPHVIENLNRKDLSSVTAAKVRTLKVLFEYVNLDPKEIMEMGGPRQVGLNDAQIEEYNEKTKQREILLQSAATKLTRDFRNWWKQGEYIFDFKADGPFFRIWVSDSKRPERIPLENRSTGLQWFLSFYLVFLVESKDSHENSILLLDEAGLSLHPLAQKDLISFFDNLALSNQIIHTTHSPFLVSPTNIERARVVYVDKDGYTAVSEDLRAAEDRQRSKSVYAIHAALGLSVSDVILQGCKPVIVEGASDQYYFNAIKQYLISNNLIAPKLEVVFLPSGGVRGISQLASLISSKDTLPYVIIDSDRSGKAYRDKLIKELYAGSESDKIIEIGNYTSISDAEVEDVIPYALIDRYLGHILHSSDQEFNDCYDDKKPIIPQIELFANNNEITLPDGYKVEMAKAAKMLLQGKRAPELPKEYVDRWANMFSKLCE